VEVTTDDGHLLCIGVTLPDLKGAPAAEVCKLIHQQGGLAIPPHPYDFFRAGIRETTLETLEIDAVEVFNSATTLKGYNSRALEYAKRRGLPMTAGSDAHHKAAIGTAFTILDTDDFSLQGVLRQIVKNNQRTERYLSIADSIRKTWNNWLRLRNHRPAG
jgi:predicted metal-dependent phosphoesterase TrpH